jgi:uncharacterized protein YkwD
MLCSFSLTLLGAASITSAQSAAPSTAHRDRPPSAARSASVSQERGSAEQVLFDSLNRERTSRGLAALAWDQHLAAAAGEHAQRMADANTLEHQLPGEPDMKSRVSDAGARFAMVAENIAVGSSPAELHAEWMHSPGHRANILDPQLTAVGIATVRASGGLFAVQDFSRAVVTLSLVEQEKRVSDLLSALGLLVSEARDEARKNCDASLGISGIRAASIIRFESSDLSKLSDGTVKSIKSHSFRRAMVGACPTFESAGFAHFKIAVVLY